MLADLLDELRKHYEAREFPSDAIDRLLIEIPRGIENGLIARIGVWRLQKDVTVLRLIEELRKVRLDISAAPAPSNAQAIFCFSCGYRLKHRVVTALGEENRLPGPNNREMARIAERLKRERDALPIYAQFEIADALDDYTDLVADYSSPPKDMGTDEVIRWFTQDLRSKGKDVKVVFVVAHQHHMKRCLLLLNDEHGIVGIPAPEKYLKYDPGEKQERFSTPKEFILSDAASTVLHLGTR